MTRLQDPDLDQVPDGVREFVGKLPSDPMFKMLTHSVTTVQPLIHLAEALYTSLKLPVRSRELVILTLAQETKCANIFAQHVPISEAAGVGEDIRQLIEKRDYENVALSAHDRTIIQFTAEAVAQGQVTDELFSLTRKFLSEREIVELLHVCGYYWTLSRVCTVLKVELTQVYAQEYGADWPSEASP
jgi:alkylhydroperoxidase family enzyme